MQKKIIALAVAALASGAALAQSNVTVYGIADATFDNVRSNGATANGANYQSRSRVTANSSYIGFKGVEDLGNGLKAVFQFENGVSFDNAAGAWANRDSYVALAGGFGTVAAGNLTGPARAMGAKMDVNAGATGIGANTAILAKLGGGSGAGVADQRLTNAIAYISPTFSGFNGVLGYSTGINAATVPRIAGFIGTNDESKGAGSNLASNTAWTLGLNYENGPIYVGYAYTNVANKNIAATDDIDNHRVAGKYSASWGSVGLVYDRTKLDITNGSDLRQNVWLLPVTVNVSAAGKIVGQYGKAGDIKGNGAANQGASFFALGYEHALSKRTMLKASYAQITNKADATYDFLYGVSSANSTAQGNGVTAGSDPKGFSVGVRHSF